MVVLNVTKAMLSVSLAVPMLPGSMPAVVVKRLRHLLQIGRVGRAGPLTTASSVEL